MSTGAKRRIAGLTIAIVVVVAGACSSDGDDVQVSDTTSTSEPAADGSLENDPDDWIGLDEEEAIEQAEAEGREWRVVMRDGEDFIVTQDFIEDRVNFSIDDGVVTDATFG